jgi:uncharacterized metal-binding protein YceD (DUF177 family)
MFKINLGSFEDSADFSYELKKSDVTFEGLDYEDGLSINLTVTKDSDDSLVVIGDISGSIDLTCGRCLDGYKQPIESHFVTIFKERQSITPDDEENDVLPYDRNKLDLFDCLRETLLLEVPLKPLCRETCLGICPVCGKNQNTQKCDCDKTIKLEETFRPFSGLDL